MVFDFASVFQYKELIRKTNELHGAIDKLLATQSCERRIYLLAYWKSSLFLFISSSLDAANQKLNELSNPYFNNNRRLYQYTKHRNCIDIHSAGTKPMNDQKTVCHIWKNNNNYLTSREIKKKRYWSNILPAVYLYTASGCDRKQLRIKRSFFFLRIAEKQMKDQMRRDEI